MWGYGTTSSGIGTAVVDHSPQETRETFVDISKLSTNLFSKFRVVGWPLANESIVV